MAKLSGSLKAVVAIVVSAAGALVTVLGTDNGSLSHLTLTQWLVAAGAVLGSGGVVYFCQNGPEAPVIKAVVGFLSAGVASLVVALHDGHISQAEYLTAFIAAVVATGAVYQVTNRGQ